MPDFTKALTCLTKIGDEVDISATTTQLKMSTVNASRSAFGVFTFQPSFFDKYELSGSTDSSNILTFSIAGKVSSFDTHSCKLAVAVSMLLDGQQRVKFNSFGHNLFC
jgi:hypothetical protein